MQLDKVTVAELQFSDAYLKRQMIKVEKELQKFAVRSQKHLKLTLSMDTTVAQKALTKYMDLVRNLSRATIIIQSQAHKSLAGMLKGLSPARMPNVKSLIQSTVQQIVSPMSAVIQHSQTQALGAITTITNNKALNKRPSAIVSQFKQQSNLTTQTGGDPDQITKAYQAANDQLNALLAARLQAVAGNQAEIEQLTNEHADHMAALEFQRNKSLINVEADRRTQISHHLAELRNLADTEDATSEQKWALRRKRFLSFSAQERQTARTELMKITALEKGLREQRGNEILEIIKREEALVLKEREEQYHRELQAAAMNIKQQRRLEKQWLEEQKEIRRAYGSQYFQVKQETTRIAERKSPKPGSSGLSQRDFGMFQGMRDMFKGMGPEMAMNLTQLLSPVNLLMAGVAGLGVVFQKLGQAAQQTSKDMYELNKSLSQTEQAQLTGLKSELQSISIIGRRAFGDITKSLKSWMTSMPDAEFGPAVENIRSLTKASEAYGIESETINQVLAVQANKWKLNINDTEATAQRINNLAAVSKLARIELNDMSGEATALVDKVNSLSASSETAERGFNGMLTVLGQATGNGDVAIEMFDELFEIIAEPDKIAKLGEANEQLRATGKALVEGVDFDKGLITDWEKFIGTVGRAGEAVVEIDKKMQPFDFRKLVDPGEDAQGLEALRILMEAGSEGIQDALKKIEQTAGEVEGRLFVMANSVQGQMQERESMIQTISSHLGESVMGVQTSIGRLGKSVMELFLPADIAFDLASEKLHNLGAVVDGLAPKIHSATADLDSVLNDGLAFDPAMVEPLMGSIEEIRVLNADAAAQLEQVVASPAEEITNEKLKNLITSLGDLKTASEDALSVALFDTARKSAEELDSRLGDIRGRIMQIGRTASNSDEGSQWASDISAALISGGPGMNADLGKLDMGKAREYNDLMESLFVSETEDLPLAQVDAKIEEMIPKLREAMDILREGGLESSDAFASMTGWLGELQATSIDLNKNMGEQVDRAFEFADQLSAANSLQFETLSVEDQKKQLQETILTMQFESADVQAQVLQMAYERIDAEQAVAAANAEQEAWMASVYESQGLCVDEADNNIDAQIAVLEVYREQLAVQQQQLATMIATIQNALKLGQMFGSGTVMVGGKEVSTAQAQTELGMKQDEMKSIDANAKRADKAIADLQKKADSQQKDREKKETQHQERITKAAGRGGSARNRDDQKNQREADKRMKDSEREREKLEQERLKRQQDAANALQQIENEIYDTQTENQGKFLDEYTKQLFEENRRHSQHVSKLRREHGDNAQLIQAAERLHQAKIASIEGDARQKAEEESQKIAEEREKERRDSENQITDFLAQASDQRLSDRQSAIGNEITQEQRKYSEMIAMAKKHGLDVVKLEQERANAINAIYQKQITQLSLSIRETTGKIFPTHELLKEFKRLDQEMEKELLRMQSNDRVEALTREKGNIKNLSQAALDTDVRGLKLQADTALNKALSEMRREARRMVTAYARSFSETDLMSIIQQAAEKFQPGVIPTQVFKVENIAEYQNALEQSIKLEGELNEKLAKRTELEKELEGKQVVGKNITRDKIEAINAEIQATEDAINSLGKTIGDYSNQILSPDAIQEVVSRFLGAYKTGGGTGQTSEEIEKLRGLVEAYIKSYEEVARLKPLDDQLEVQIDAYNERFRQIEAELASIADSLGGETLADGVLWLDNYLKKMALVIERHDQLLERLNAMDKKYTDITPETQTFLNNLEEIAQLSTDIANERVATRQGLELTDMPSSLTLLEASTKAIGKLESALLEAGKLLAIGNLDEVLTDAAVKENQQLAEGGDALAKEFMDHMPEAGKIAGAAAATEFNMPHSPTVGQVAGSQMADQFQEDLDLTDVVALARAQENSKSQNDMDSRLKQGVTGILTDLLTPLLSLLPQYTELGKQLAVATEAKDQGKIDEINSKIAELTSSEEARKGINSLIDIINKITPVAAMKVEEVAQKGIIDPLTYLRKELEKEAKRVETLIDQSIQSREDLISAPNEFDQRRRTEKQALEQHLVNLEQQQIDSNERLRALNKQLIDAQEAGDQNKIAILSEAIDTEYAVQKQLNNDLEREEFRHAEIMRQIQRDYHIWLMTQTTDWINRINDAGKSLASTMDQLTSAFTGQADVRSGMGAIAGLGNTAAGIANSIPGGQLVGGIISAASAGIQLIGDAIGGEKDLSDVEKQKHVQDQINATLQARQKLMQTLVDLGGQLTDEAREQAQFQAETLRMLEAQIEGSAAMSAEEMVTNLNANAQRLLELRQERDQLAKEEEGEGWVEKFGEGIGQVFGYKDEKERMAEIDLEIAQIETQNLTYEQQLELRKAIAQAVMDQLAHEKRLRELDFSAGQMDSLTLATKNYKEALDTLRKASTGQLIGIDGRVVELTREQIDQLEADVLSAKEAIDEANRAEFVFDRDRMERDAAVDGKDISNEKLQSLNDQLQFERDILATLKAEGMSIDKIREQKRRIWELEKQIAQLNEKKLGSYDKELEAVVKLRQQVLAMARVDNVIDTTERGQLKDIESRIRARLLQMGIEPDQVEATIKTMDLQRFKTGGITPYSPHGVPVIVGEGNKPEFVVSNKDLQNVGGVEPLKQFLQNGYLNLPPQNTVKYQQYIQNSNSNNQNVVINAASADQIWSQLKPKLDRHWEQKQVEWERKRGSWGG